MLLIVPAPCELPIDELEDQLVAAVRAQGRLIVQAPIGTDMSMQMLYNRAHLGSGAAVVGSSWA